MNRFALPAVNGSALKAVIAIVAVTVAVLFGIDRIDLVNQIHALKAVNDDLTTQNRGVQGADGDPGRPPTEEEILAAVKVYCESSGECVGATGATGAQGAAGSPGATGRSVGSIACTNAGTRWTIYDTAGAIISSVQAICFG